MLTALGILILVLFLTSCVLVLLTSSKDRTLFPCIILSLVPALIPLMTASPLAVSDSVEYLALSSRIFFDDDIRLSFNAQAIPSRYPIWYSLVFLQPFVASGFHEFAFSSAGIIGFFLLILAGVSTLRFLDMRASIPLLLSLFLLIPELRYFSPMPLTDVISAAVWAIVLLGMAILRDRYTNKIAWSTGFILGVALVIRPTNIFLVIPVLIWFRRVPVLLPGCIFLVMNAFCNYLLYGSAFRTGYQLWMSIPYDFPMLTWNPGYILQNFQSLTQSAFFLIIPLSIMVLAMEWRKSFYAKISLLSLLPFTVMYLNYFYSSPRFYFPTIVPFLIFLVIRLSRNIPEKRASAIAAILFLVSLFPVFFAELVKDEEYREYACLPKTGYLVSKRNPLLLEEFFLKGTDVRLIPYSRKQEYAGKFITLQKPEIEDTSRISPYDHRNSILLPFDAREVYPVVFDENKEQVMTNSPVYFDSSVSPDSDGREQQVPGCPGLRQVLLP